MRLYLTAFFTLTIAFCVAENGYAQVIYENNFDQYSTDRVYTDDDLDADFDTPRFNDGVTEGRVSIVTGSKAFGGSGSAIAVSYPAGMDGTKDTGAQWQLEFDAEYEELILSYRVKFENGFDFVRGGKLPGLAGGTAPTGSTQADGTNGWTGRLMWRTDFEGVSGQPEQLVSNAISYAKYTDSGFDGTGRDEDKEYWVESDGSRTVLQSGVWYEITQRVKMNTPNQRDGILQVFLDGELVLDQNDVLFRTVDTFSIDQMYFSTFFGGNEDWRTSKDEIVYFDDFQVSTPEPVREPKFYKVPGNFDTIQEAINASLPGDTVAVRGSIYENVVLNKAIFLRGYNGTRINALDRSKPVIRITADGAHIKRFETRFGPEGVFVEKDVKDVKVEFITALSSTHAGIFLSEGCDNAWLSKNRVFYSDGHGIAIDRADNVQIVDNKTYWSKGCGYCVFSSDRAIVEDNLGWGNYVGFRIDGTNAVVFDNFAFMSFSNGFEVCGNDNTIDDNYARLSGSHGFHFAHSQHCIVTKNVARENGGNGYELTWYSDNNSVVDNIAKLNEGVGFLVEQSSYNTMDDALSLENGSGIVLASTSAFNIVKKSVARSNTLYGIRDEGSNNDTSELNYSRYNGID